MVCCKTYKSTTTKAKFDNLVILHKLYMYRGTAIDLQISKLIDPELTIVALLIELYVRLKNIYKL